MAAGSYGDDAETHGGPEHVSYGVDSERRGVDADASESGAHDGKMPSAFPDPPRGRRRPWKAGVDPDDDP